MFLRGLNEYELCFCMSAGVRGLHLHERRWILVEKDATGQQNCIIGVSCGESASIDVSIETHCQECYL